MHVKEYCEAHRIPVIRRKLDYGDYGIEVNGILQPFTVERKNSLNELAGNFSRKSRGRFKREFERAAGNIAVVVEGNFDKIECHDYRHPFPPRNYLAQLKQFTKIYKVNFHFVLIDSAAFIVKLLQEKASA